METYPTCVICGGQFNPGGLSEDGKCAVCVKEYPDAKNYAEALKQRNPKEAQMMTLTEERVREIVKDVVRDAVKEEIKIALVEDRMRKAREAKKGKSENKETE